VKITADIKLVYDTYPIGSTAGSCGKEVGLAGLAEIVYIFFFGHASLACDTHKQVSGSFRTACVFFFGHA